MSSSIPIIELSDYLYKGYIKKKQFIEAVGKSLIEKGVFIVTQHGLWPDIQYFYKKTGTLFNDLSSDILNQFSFRKNHGILRGYVPPTDPYSKREKWISGPNSNYYPAQLKDFSDVDQALFIKYERVAESIAEALILYIENLTNSSQFRTMMEDKNGYFNGYKTLNTLWHSKIKEENYKIENLNKTKTVLLPHTDPSLFSLVPRSSIQKNSEPGLEVKLANRWVRAFTQRVPQDAIFIFPGQFLDLITKGLTDSQEHSLHIKAKEHRVTLSEQSLIKDREIVTFLVYPNLLGSLINLKSGKTLSFLREKSKNQKILGLEYFYKHYSKGYIPSSITYEEFEQRFRMPQAYLEEVIQKNKIDAINY